ncbi:hypothetical protein SAMN04488498_107124 [Mesorhizobium albiziae]|uniref:Uncharacterized protein n=1 Tax=Neomesorhizobium albiziae TaxID=335020 RepID=A0A1I4A363_9HYPH|nr:hypothetical protein SAMN04488498_107124 [Mesorhizobium albiziae]
MQVGGRTVGVQREDFPRKEAEIVPVFAGFQTPRVRARPSTAGL